MSSDNWGEIGADPQIVRTIRKFYPDYPDGPLGEATTDPQTALLAIRVEQEEGDDIVTGDPDTDTTAAYFSKEFTVTTDGPRVTDANGNQIEPSYVDGKEIDTEAVYSEWDVRGFDDDIMIAFKEPAREHREIKYPSGDSPLAGIPATTRYVWLWRADSATSNPTVRLEGWS